MSKSSVDREEFIGLPFFCTYQKTPRRRLLLWFTDGSWVRYQEGIISLDYITFRGSTSLIQRAGERFYSHRYTMSRFLILNSSSVRPENSGAERVPFRRKDVVGRRLTRTPFPVSQCLLHRTVEVVAWLRSLIDGDLESSTLFLVGGSTSSTTKSQQKKIPTCVRDWLLNPRSKTEKWLVVTLDGESLRANRSKYSFPPFLSFTECR